jgi:hypothetical protein
MYWRFWHVLLARQYVVQPPPRQSMLSWPHVPATLQLIVQCAAVEQSINVLAHAVAVLQLIVQVSPGEQSTGPGPLTSITQVPPLHVPPSSAHADALQLPVPADPEPEPEPEPEPGPVPLPSPVLVPPRKSKPTRPHAITHASPSTHLMHHHYATRARGVQRDHP